MASSLSSKICAGCKNTLPKKGFLTCSNCGSKYDSDCANILPNQLEKMDQQLKSSWKCPECCSKQPKSGNTNTPVRASALCTDNGTMNSYVTTRRKQNGSPRSKSSSTPDDLCAPPGSNFITESSLRDILRQELSITIQDMVSAQLKTINDQITGFRESMSFINEKFEEVKSTMAERATIIAHLQKENDQLRVSVKDLQTRLNTVELHMRECNVEINGIPEHRTENLVNTIAQLNATVGISISTDEIQHVTRVAKLNKRSDKPRSVIVKYRSTKHRDALLAAVSQFNRKNPDDKLSSHHLGIGGPRAPVYVSEHLTPGSKSLHAATRLKAKEMNYRFTWIRNGKVYVRKDEFSQAILIKTEDSLRLII
ncbi:unnamed protein product [Euphydryas editha]|uniref:FP protein C-terminal domain-containing protein n=1 Tax=Euphydryas editha TaxID=104508 RepID=A0AAU9UIZ8_EUPED|nr:unnamed protein product [Euphydryas editha]